MAMVIVGSIPTRGSAPGTVATCMWRPLWTLVVPSMRYQSTANPYGDNRVVEVSCMPNGG